VNQQLSELGSESLAMVLTAQEVAERLRVPVSWVYERTRRRGPGCIPHRKMGKYLRFLAEEVDDWFRSLPGV
jgi:excisionase family DNA binding protein